MRLKIFIEDIEYRDALVETLSKSEKNIYIELIDSITSDCFAHGTILLTDIDETYVLDNVSDENLIKVVVLTNCAADSITPDTITVGKANRLFKFQNANSILSQIAELNCIINGSIGSQLVSTKKYLVCGDSTAQCSLFSNLLARQIRFRHGGTILVLSLTYINSHPVSEEKDYSCFARMMYLRNIGRIHSQDNFTYTDTYGVTYVRLPVGNNPLAYFDLESLLSLFNYLCEGRVETLIIDIGSEFSANNQKLINLADEVLVVNHGGRSTNWNTFSVLKAKEVSQIKKEFSNTDIELNIDDYIREKYGVMIEDETQEDNNKKIRRRDRQARS